MSIAFNTRIAGDHQLSVTVSGNFSQGVVWAEVAPSLQEGPSDLASSSAESELQGTFSLDLPGVAISVKPGQLSAAASRLSHSTLRIAQVDRDVWRSQAFDVEAFDDFGNNVATSCNNLVVGHASAVSLTTSNFRANEQEHQ